MTRSGIYSIGERELRYYNFASEISEPILAVQKRTSEGMSVSPDEHWLLYTQVDQGGSDLMLVENFR